MACIVADFKSCVLETLHIHKKDTIKRKEITGGLTTDESREASRDTIDSKEKVYTAALPTREELAASVNVILQNSSSDSSTSDSGFA